MAIGKKVRFEIFKRDKFTCQYCGRKPPEVVLNVDHVVPVSKDGSDEPHNLLTGCWDCNIGKSNNLLDRVDVPLAVHPESIREKLDQIKAYEAAMSEHRVQNEVWVNEVMEYWATLGNGWFVKDGKRMYGYHPTIRASVLQFIKLTSKSEIMDAVEIAFRKFTMAEVDEIFSRDRFKFFCGVCWRKIKKDATNVR